MQNTVIENTANEGSLIHDEVIKRDIFLRMRTISGHLSGVEKMIEEDAYCVDILRQIAAIQASLSRVALALIENHMRHCVQSAVTQGEGEVKIEELMETFRYLKHF